MATVRPVPWAKLYHEDPYRDFPLDSLAPDLQGWGSRDPIFAHLIELVRPRTILEVGTWKGASAFEMARQAKRLGVEAEIICIDTWLGSPEHFLKRDHPAYWDSLRMRNGYPRLYEQFLANVLHEGHQDVIVPLAQTSGNAAEILRKVGITAQLIYIDAAHEYDPVMQDLAAYWPLLEDGGVLFGDDFAHPPVARAATDFAERSGLTLHSTDKKFALARNDLPWPP